MLDPAPSITDQNKTRDEGQGGPLLPARAVWERYRVTGRTLDRWVESATLGFPEVIQINKRRYFRLVELEDWERRQARGQTAANRRGRPRKADPVDTTQTRIA